MRPVEISSPAHKGFSIPGYLRICHPARTRTWITRPQASSAAVRDEIGSDEWSLPTNTSPGYRLLRDSPNERAGCDAPCVQRRGERREGKLAKSLDDLLQATNLLRHAGKLAGRHFLMGDATRSINTISNHKRLRHLPGRASFLAVQRFPAAFRH